MSDRFSLRRLHWFCFVFPVTLLLLGCNKASTESDSSTSSGRSEITRAVYRVSPEVKPVRYKFEPAMMLTAGGERIEVDEDGHACPTLFDFDKDGVDDLIVGQANKGKMKWYRNLSGRDETPKYAKGKWIYSGPNPAEVPGVG